MHRFAELAKLIQPDGPKTDKPSILTDAVKYVQQLTVECNQLKQLNKFLEVWSLNFGITEQIQIKMHAE